MQKRMSPTIITLIALAGPGLFSSAGAQMEPQLQDSGRVAVGTLVCTSPDAEAQAFDPGTPLMCNYTPAGSNDRQTYTGTIRQTSSDAAPQGRGVMSWSVLARSEAGVAGLALAGTYTRANDAEQGNGPASGRQALVGGTQGAFELQPLNAQGTEGTDLDPAIERLILEPAP